MIRYRIRVETPVSLIYLRKEYYSFPQAVKARKMINFAKYSNCVIKIYRFEDEKRGELLELTTCQRAN